MKKKLLIFLGIFIFIIIPKNVFALSYEVEGTTYQVNDETSLLHYCYFNLPFTDDLKDFVFFKFDNSQYRCFILGSDPHSWKTSTSAGLNWTGSTSGILFNSSDFSIINTPTGTGTNYMPNSGGSLLYSTADLLGGGSVGFLFSKNLSIEDITSNYFFTITYYLNDEEYLTYNVSAHSSHNLYNYSIPEGFSFSGWSYDENIDLSDITSNVSIYGYLTEIEPTYTIINNFPITKNEFYALLIMLGTLIIMLFLKWCFPFKSGSDLK